MKINNIKDFVKARNCGEGSFLEARQNTFKFVMCGPDLYRTSKGIEVTCNLLSPNTQSPNQTSTYFLDYPFEIHQFWEILEDIEEEAKELWANSFGCIDCGKEDLNSGFIKINKNCKSCGGYGRWRNPRSNDILPNKRL
tara:strand:+ start:74 stop:490 length:417 start_codon:yes stop_codon:yes gene_type:complete